ncbi:vesicular glutamate transporter 1 [Aplysia californica]|uniref:Vesicular glutamate transporter 1 n=1 Tax=Aplysia californica TaxID=6500 RepID=A0ABM1A9Y6_APLCA|nr:vesicular glutamate transporter 1 [Aplysia californica]
MKTSLYRKTCCTANSMLVSRWAKGFAETSPAETDLHDQARCGPPTSASAVQHKKRVDEIIQANRPIRLKEYLKGKPHADDYEIKEDVRRWFRGKPHEFFADGMRQLIRRWRICIDEEGNYVEKVTCLMLVMPTLYKLGSAPLVFALRVVHGVVDATVQPSLVFLVVAWAFKYERSRLMSLALLGSVLGPSLGNAVSGITICFVSWDFAFYLFGAAGLTWAAFWCLTIYSLPSECPHLEERELCHYDPDQIKVQSGSHEVARHIPWKRILLSKSVWAIWLGTFNKCWVNSVLTTLQPQFFNDVYGLRAADIGLFLSAQPLLNSVFVMLGATLADKLMYGNILSATGTRKLLQALGGYLEGFFMIAVAFSPDWRYSYAFFLSAYAFGGLSFNGYKVNRVDLSSQYANIVAGLSLTGSSGGAGSTLLASLILEDRSFSSWRIVAIVTGALSFACSTAYLFMASGERQDWDMERPPNKSAKDKSEDITTDVDDKFSEKDSLLDDSDDNS